jgi:serine/threonine protein kinase
MRVSCTLRYAPPEAINAHRSMSKLTVEPSLDIWALGVIMFECLAGCPAFRIHSGVEEVFECAQGLQPYPWERPLEKIPEGWSKSRACTFFKSCLARDPAARPTANQLLKSLHKLSNTTSHATG